MLINYGFKHRQTALEADCTPRHSTELLQKADCLFAGRITESSVSGFQINSGFLREQMTDIPCKAETYM